VTEWSCICSRTAGKNQLKPEDYIDLLDDSPAQGAMLVVAMANDEYSRQALHELNDIDTEICTHIERQFLKL
jgi:hydroxymethylbilane synthase